MHHRQQHRREQRARLHESQTIEQRREVYQRRRRAGDAENHAPIFLMPDRSRRGLSLPGAFCLGCMITAALLLLEWMLRSPA